MERERSGKDRSRKTKGEEGEEKEGGKWEWEERGRGGKEVIPSLDMCCTRHPASTTYFHHSAMAISLQDSEKLDYSRTTEQKQIR